MTTIVRWHPIRDIDAMQDAMRMLNDTWRDTQSNRKQQVQRHEIDDAALPFDAYETEDTYTIIAALPGVNADDIDVKLHDGVLTIQGEIPAQRVIENAQPLLKEGVYGKFVRHIHLPQLVHTTAVEASYHDGILTLKIPKTGDTQARVIPVKPRSKQQS